MSTTTMGGALRHLRDLFGEGTVVGLTDGQLLARYVDRQDGPAFAALVARHGPMVLGACRAILKHEHDVEDAFQATFLVLARRAASVRDGDALAGWLHRVAYHAAVRVKVDVRRRLEREIEFLAKVTSERKEAGPTALSEIQTIVHEEINRLPDQGRLAVVLCDLQGLTYEQAAYRLHCTVPALRCRLAKARKRLRDRLTRRGMAPGAQALGALMPSPAVAVPVAWTWSVVSTATAGRASVIVASLSRLVIRSLFEVRLVIASLALLVSAVAVSAGVFAIGAIGHDEPKPAPRAPSSARASAAELPGGKDTEPPAISPQSIRELRGRVVGPDAQPVPGAVLRAGWQFNNDRDDQPEPDTISGPDGRFVLRIRRPRRDSTMLYGIPMAPWVVASAPGFGVGGALVSDRPGASGELIVRLVDDGPPIEGRILNLEGRPVPDARIEVGRIWYAKDGNLGDLIEKNRAGAVRDIWNGLKEIQATIATTTDSEGHFRLTGIGRDQVADMLVSGSTIATTRLLAMSRNASEAQCFDRWPETTTIVFHAPRFTHVAAPIKPIEGVLRDKDTGRPIAGMKLRASVVDKKSSVIHPALGVEAITDANGRYRLSGLPKAAEYRIFVEPGPGLPYIKARFVAGAGSYGLDPVTFDIKLKRGIVVRGRVTDKATGLPARGYVHSFTFRNPQLVDFPGYNGLPNYAYLDEDGRFEVVAMPGRGIIACHSEALRYRRGVGAASIKGYDAEREGFLTRPMDCTTANYHAMVEVNLDAGAESAKADLQVDPGRSLGMNVIDPSGMPIGGTKVVGLSDLHPLAEFDEESPTIAVHGLDPSRPRRVIVTLAARKLIGSLYIKGDEAGPLTVRLQPWGTIIGRIVDDEGKPRGGMGLFSAGGIFPSRPDVQGVLADAGWIGPDGRFRFDRLVPGLKYGASVNDGVITLVGELFADLAVAPGEVKDLGDLKVIPHKKDSPP